MGSEPGSDPELFVLRFRPFRAVLRSALLPITDAGTIERAAYCVISNTREILNSTATNQHNRVLLKIVAFATDIAGDFESIGQPDSSDFPHRGVRLLRRGGIHAGANAAFLRAAIKCRDRAFNDF